MLVKGVPDGVLETWKKQCHISVGHLDLHEEYALHRVRSILNACAQFCWVWWWRHQMETFPRYWPFVRGIHQWPVNSPHKGQWRGALMFSLIWAWINGWVNNRKAGDLRHHRVHCDVIVMCCFDLVVVWCDLLNHLLQDSFTGTGIISIITWLCGFWREITSVLP